MAGFSLAISGPKTHFEVAGARGAPGTGFIARRVGAGWPPPRKKYEIRYPSVPGGLISPKTVSGVLTKNWILTSGGGWRAWGARHRVCRALRRGWVATTPEKIRNPVSARSEWSNFAQNRFGRFARIPGFPHPEVAGAPGDPGTGSAGLYVGVWGTRPGKKYEIRYPAGPGGPFSLKTVKLVLMKNQSIFTSGGG